MSSKQAKGTLALVGGAEWTDGCRALDGALLEVAGANEVAVLPTAAAFEHPDRAVDRARAHFAALGAKVKPIDVLHRAEAEDATVIGKLAKARFVYLADGSPLHLRSVLKDSPLFDALLAAYQSGAVLAASGAGATVVCDPMVDPRGGAYTVGLGVVVGLAVFPYHGTAADHLRERSIDLLPDGAALVGIDEATALVRDPSGIWRAEGAGRVSVYEDGRAVNYTDGQTVDRLTL
ncbi:MAG TPA: Type 1 glutamine amidotransferase-like domain-containing protein [Acidimicrobiia bacterium]